MKTKTILARKDIANTIFNDSVFLIANNLVNKKDAIPGTINYGKALRFLGSIVKNVGNYNYPIWGYYADLYSSTLMNMSERAENATRAGVNGFVGIVTELYEDEQVIYDKVKPLVGDGSFSKELYLTAYVIDMLCEGRELDYITEWFENKWLNFTKKDITECVKKAKSALKDRPAEEIISERQCRFNY